MGLEKRLYQGSCSEAFLILKIEEIRRNRIEEKTNQKIKNFIYAGIGVSALIGGGVFYIIILKLFIRLKVW